MISQIINKKLFLTCLTHPILKQSQKLIDDVLNDFGSIDVLVNNAGITIDNLLMRMSEEDFKK